LPRDQVKKKDGAQEGQGKCSNSHHKSLDLRRRVGGRGRRFINKGAGGRGRGGPFISGGKRERSSYRPQRGKTPDTQSDDKKGGGRGGNIGLWGGG